MSGDLLQLLFVAAFILFGLLGSRKKRPPLETRSRTQPPATRLPTRSPEPAPASEQGRLLRELEGLLTGRPVPAEPAAPAPPWMGDSPDPEEARSLESLEDETSANWEEGIERATEAGETARWSAGRDRAAESLETLEEAGGASHERFHSLYDRQPEPLRTQPAPATFPTAEMRRAIVWSEILGVPVSER